MQEGLSTKFSWFILVNKRYKFLYWFCFVTLQCIYLTVRYLHKRRCLLIVLEWSSKQAQMFKKIPLVQSNCNNVATIKRKKKRFYFYFCSTSTFFFPLFSYYFSLLSVLQSYFSLLLCMFLIYYRTKCFFFFFWEAPN